MKTTLTLAIAFLLTGLVSLQAQTTNAVPIDMDTVWRERVQGYPPDRTQPGMENGGCLGMPDQPGYQYKSVPCPHADQDLRIQIEDMQERLVAVEKKLAESQKKVAALEHSTTDSRPTVLYASETGTVTGDGGPSNAASWMVQGVSWTRASGDMTVASCSGPEVQNRSNRTKCFPLDAPQSEIDEFIQSEDSRFLRN